MHRLFNENKELQKYKSYAEKYEKLKGMLDVRVAKVSMPIMKYEDK
jgi:hypothetical protein